MDTKYLKSVGMYLLSAVVSIFLISYVVHHMAGRNVIFAETEPVLQTAINRSVSFDAFIFREELLIYTQTAGVNYVLVSQGERVRDNTPVIEIFRPMSNAAQQLAELDAQIHLLQQSNTSGRGVHYIANLDNRINNLYHELLERTAVGDMLNSRQLEARLLIYINRRNVASASISNFNSAIAALERQRNDIVTASRGDVLGRVTAPVGGNFSSDLDGFERTFRPNLLNGISISDFLSLTNSQPDQYVASFEPNEAGRIAVGKLMTDTQWHVAAMIHTSEISDMRIGQSYPITFVYNGNHVIDKTLDRIVTEFGNDYALLIFSSRTVPDNFDFIRVQAAQITFRVYRADRTPIREGLQIPVTSVRYYDGRVGVFILAGGNRRTATFREIYIIKEVDGSFILCPDESQLRRFDLMITTGRGIREGLLLR